MSFILPRAALAFLMATSAATAAEWRSSLYPTDWTPPHERPGLDFVADRFVQDFSYAGYRQNTGPLPTPAGPIFDVVAGHGADPTGTTDATAAIQAAIDAATTAGGGVVLLPAGTYRVSRPSEGSACLRVAGSNVVLRGAGVDRTFLVNTSTAMRSARVVQFQPADGGSWSLQASSHVLLTRDELGPTTTLQLADVSSFAVGDRIIVHNPATAAFIDDVKMGLGSDGVNWKDSLSNITGPRQPARIVAIDTTTRELTLDAPTRWFLKTRDGARIYRARTPLTEVGIENLSIGNVSHPGNGWGEEDYTNAANAAYDAHDSFLIELRGVENGWVRDVQSYNPGNANGAHLLSNGLLLSFCRNVTLRDVSISHTQYGGGGGNGYGIRLNSVTDCLVLESTTGWMRHGIVMWQIDNAGNVVSDCFDHDTGHQQGTGTGTVTATAGRGSDHHGVLSHSNLVDRNSVNASYFEAAYRGDWGGNPDHGNTSSQCVIWNTIGEAYHPDSPFVVHSQQFGHGYIIGTQGAASAVLLTEKRPGSAARTDPVDFTEGIGNAAELVPQSLFRDQLARRLGVQANWLLNPVTISQQPASQTIAPGGSATFTAAIEGEPQSAPVYQWFKDGLALAGATNLTLTLNALSTANNGAYHLEIEVDGNTLRSRPAHLLVAIPQPGDLVNESVLTDVTPGRPLTVGFTLAGGERSVLVRGVGPSLDTFFGNLALLDPDLTLNRTGAGATAEPQRNLAWNNDPAIAASAVTVGAFPLTSPHDAALQTLLPAGNYTAVLEAATAGGSKALLEVYALPASTAPVGHLVNLSALRELDDTAPGLTAGFVIEGNVPKTVLLRAVGPSLRPYVGETFLRDPVLTVYRLVGGKSEQLLQLDDWQDEGTWRQTAAGGNATGAFGLTAGSTDAAVVLTLQPGSHTVQVDRKGNDHGQALLEIYELP